jgi:hypothetical protein
MVVVRDGETTTKGLLAPRFQEAIDEAAMRLGETGADDYLSGWVRTDWAAGDDAPDATLERVLHELDDAWPEDRVAAYLDRLGPAS